MTSMKAKHSHTSTLPYFSALWKLWERDNDNDALYNRSDICPIAQDLFLQQALIVWEKQILEIARERLRPAAWLISVGFGIPTWQHFVTWYL
jgi:hypothetical protein